MTPYLAAYALATVLVMVVFAWLTSYDKVRQQRDALYIKAARLQDALLETELAFTLEATEHEATKQALWDAGREAATHADHLTAVMDAVAEDRPLTLLRGGRR